VSVEVGVDCCFLVGFYVYIFILLMFSAGVFLVAFGTVFC
jgi:hypothetical protein